MTEILFYLQTFVNQCFFATLVLIILNKIWRKIEIKIPLQIIRYTLIASVFLYLIELLIIEPLTPNDEGNTINFVNRATGPYRTFYITVIIFKIFLPLLLLIRKIGKNKYIILIIAFLITIPLWFERFVIIVTSIHRGHLPSTWSMFYPTWVDVFKYLLIIISLIIIIDS